MLVRALGIASMGVALWDVVVTTLVALDTVSLIQSALDEEKYATLKLAGSLGQLSRCSLKLVSTLLRMFLKSHPPAASLADNLTRERWGRRYLEARQRFQQAGIAVASNEGAGLSAYLEARKCWDPMVMALAPAMKLDPREIDPAGSPASSR